VRDGHPMCHLLAFSVWFASFDSGSQRGNSSCLGFVPWGSHDATEILS
jgi:hypothetical protein